MQKSFITLMLALLSTLPTAAFAEQALVPQSGQVLCYDAAGTEIPCAGTGQDGDLQMGIPWPSPRFTDNNNGTVTDNLTGLIWLKNANCFGRISPWSNALSAANTLASGSCGLTDGSVAGHWRLPNRNELGSLINRQQSDSAAWLNTVGFSGVSTQYGTYYWSSSSNSNGGYAWAVYFGDGNSGLHEKTYRNYYVWPVRGGQ